MAAYQRYNLAQLKALLADRVGNIRFWYEDEFNYAINEAISVFQALTGYWTTFFPLSLVAGQSFYDVPKQVVSVRRVTFNGAPLTPTSTPELDLSFGSWEGTAGTPEYWAPEGLSLVAIYPVPSTSATVVLEGFSDAPWLTTDADFIDIGDDDLNALLEYGHHYLTFKEGGQEFKSSQPDFQSFLNQGAEKNGKLRATTFYRKWMGQDHEATQRRSSTPTPPGARA